ncbi:type VII secretion protein EccB [Streptomyces sp. NPDC050504]|uniref:type VII secretion protein EccB n=1 Tax=Streptomyces sp. NPDC050504 TaxID=3365618 RepID=UPI0037A589F6
MASRQDELNAYTFAKRRLVAQFLQPGSSGSEEGAPRPLRAVLPGAVVAVVVLAVFAAWGMFKPVAPRNWSEVGENVIIADKSTTRYVVLRTGGRKQLHPVLNMASARLLLDPDKGGVIKVEEEVLDDGRIPHGATLGIPYAPDRLPGPDEAGAAKRWAVCERQGAGGRAVQRAVFVLAEREEGRVEGPDRLRGGELLYVAGGDGTRHVVDAAGTAYELPSDALLLRALVGEDAVPQRVSDRWLATLHKGDPIAFPKVPGEPGAKAEVPGIRADLDRVGLVVQAPSGGTVRHYVVLRGRVAPVTDFTARLLLGSGQLKGLAQNSRALPVGTADFTPSGTGFNAAARWPESAPKAVDAVGVRQAGEAAAGRGVVCNVLRDVAGKDGTTTLSTWAGRDFPAPLPTGQSSAYVTPGSGQLFRQFKGGTTGAGFLFLVTDTGLRYATQSNGDSATDDAGIGTPSRDQREEALQAQTRLGYRDVDPAPVPAAWSELLPTGPRLSTAAARQPQGS